MIDRTVEIEYNRAGQELFMFPPEWADGVPSGAAAKVYKGGSSNDDPEEFAPDVTIDATNITVDADSGYSQANRRKLALANTTGLVARRPYIAENDDIQRELVAPRRIVLNDYIEVDPELAYDYPATTARLRGLRMSAPIDPTWVATEEKILLPEEPSYRVIWTYTIGGVARRHYTYLRLVRQAAKHGVTLQDLMHRYPELPFQEWMSSRGLQFADFIDGCWERLRAMLLNDGWRAHQFHDTEGIGELLCALVIYRAARVGLTPGSRDPETWVLDTKADFDSLYVQMVKARQRLEVEQGTEGATERAPLDQAWFKQ